MENKKLQDLSNEELLKKEKASKFASYLLAGVLSFLFISIIYGYSKKGFEAINVVPFALLPILVLSFKNLKEIRTELNSRERNKR